MNHKLNSLKDKIMYFYHTNSFDPAWNISCEEYFLEHRPDIDQIFSLWQNDNAIIIGRYQNAESEINLKYAETNNIRFVRRPTGGGCVYHDLGNVNYTLIKKIEEIEESDMTLLANPVISALRSLGLSIEFSGRNDFLVEGKKVSGNAQRIMKDRILQHGTLLFNSDLTVLEKALKVDALKIQSKGLSSVRSRVANMKEYIMTDQPIESFIDSLYIELEKQLGQFTPYVFTKEDHDKIQEIYDSKFNNWDWNMGHAPAFNYQHQHRFPKGKVEVKLFIENGQIKECSISGDFLGLHPIEPVVEKLIGLQYKRQTVKDALQDMSIESNFGGITADNILEVMFAA